MLHYGGAKRVEKGTSGDMVNDILNDWRGDVVEEIKNLIAISQGYLL